VSADKKHMDRVASLGCCLCGACPVELHHVLEGRTPGRRASNWLVIPLCPDCHRGSHNGIHGQRAMLRIRKTSEMELLARTLEAVYGR
jgi:hypothetical protein